MVHSTFYCKLSERWKCWAGLLEFCRQHHKELWWSGKDLPTDTDPQPQPRKVLLQVQKNAMDRTWCQPNNCLLECPTSWWPDVCCGQELTVECLWILQWCHLSSVPEPKASSSSSSIASTESVSCVVQSTTQLLSTPPTLLLSPLVSFWLLQLILANTNLASAIGVQSWKVRNFYLIFILPSKKIYTWSGSVFEYNLSLLPSCDRALEESGAVRRSKCC